MLTTFLNLYLTEPFQRLRIANQISTSRYLWNKRDFFRTTDYFIVVVIQLVHWIGHDLTYGVKW